METILDASQRRYMASCIADPSTMEDIWDEAAKSKSVNPWIGKEKDTLINPEGKKRSDGYETVVRRMFGTLDTTDTTRISWGQRIRKFNVREVDLEHIVEDRPNGWKHAIRTVDAIPIFTDRSRAEDGTVAGGYHLLQGTLGVTVGKVATAWDEEVAGLEKGILVAANMDWKILLLSDSKARIQAIQNEGVSAKARTRALARLGKEFRNRERTYGVENALIAWVKSYISIKGNEEANEMAKFGSMKEKGGEITEGGI